MVSTTLLISIVLGYFAVLFIIAQFTSKQSDSETFFTAKRQSPWILVAIGMIGATLSGVTFISIPGVVGAEGYNQGFSYMQMVFGYLVGYFIIATVLMPLYYKYNLTSIYTYLGQRFGVVSHKSGAAFFLLSRIIGASFRLYLVTLVFQTILGDEILIPFWIITLVTIVLIWVYTFRGGIKTIVWTDMLQTFSMLLAVILTIVIICSQLNMGIGDIPSKINNAGLGQWFFTDNGWSDPNNFFKQFISGALIALVMTGLDQDMMQKNLTCKSIKEAQMNMGLFSIVLVFAKLMFLVLGALLYIYSYEKGIAIPEKTDQLYPILAIQHLGPVVAISFVIGIIAAAYSSADSALTALTTSFCIDFLDFEKKERTEEEKKKLRLMVHFGFSIVIFLVIIRFNALNNGAVINGLFKASTYTYGPILGLFAFGIFNKLEIRDKWVWGVCLLAPVLSYVIDINAETWFNGFSFGYLILALNGFLTFIGLWLLSIGLNKNR